LGIAPPAFWTTFDSLFYQIFEDLSRMRATPVATVYSGVVSASTGVTVTGTYNGAQTGPITVLPLPTITALAISPSLVASGANATVSVTLSAAAPSSGAVIYLLGTNSSAFNPPATLTVAGGQTSQSATVAAGTVNASTSVTVTGIYNSTNQSATATVSPLLQITSTHSGNFSQGQKGAVYTLLVSNPAATSIAPGTVTVTESAPAGLTLMPMIGAGWTCSGNTCSRGDGLSAGSSYPPIAVTVNVAPTASSPQVNTASLTANSVAGSAVDSTTILANTLSVTSVTPNSGSGPYQVFTTVFTDPNGAANLSTAAFWIATPNATGLNNSCQVSYSFSTGQPSLLGDDGITWAALSPGYPLGNSQCILVWTPSDAIVNGASATLTLEIYFNAPYAGAKNLFAYAADPTQNTGWNNMGTWTAAQPSLPYPQSMSPSAFTTTGQTNMTEASATNISFTFTDATGWTDMQGYQIGFGAPGTTPGCLLVYYASVNTLNLYDNGTQTSSGYPGYSGTPLSNSQCTVYLNGPQAVEPLPGSTGLANENLTLTLPIVFSNTFANANPTLRVYAQVDNAL
jgi:hypothetical protein